MANTLIPIDEFIQYLFDTSSAVAKEYGLDEDQEVELLVSIGSLVSETPACCCAKK